MPCKHLKELYEICQNHQLTLSSTDLIRILCPKCGVEEVCPSVLVEEYETRHHEVAEPAESCKVGENVATDPSRPAGSSSNG